MPRSRTCSAQSVKHWLKQKPGRKYTLPSVRLSLLSQQKNHSLLQNHEQAELITPTPVPAQPLIYCTSLGNPPSYLVSVCFSEVPWTREDTPPECRRQQIKNWQQKCNSQPGHQSPAKHLSTGHTVRFLYLPPRCHRNEVKRAESQTHRMVEVRRDFWRSSGPTPMLKQGDLDPVAPDRVQTAFE